MIWGLHGNNKRGIAQSGSASALGAEGQRFKSSHPDHFFKGDIMVDFIVNVFTLGAAIFVGSMAVDWYRNRRRY